MAQTQFAERLGNDSSIFGQSIKHSVPQSVFDLSRKNMLTCISCNDLSIFLFNLSISLYFHTLKLSNCHFCSFWTSLNFDISCSAINLFASIFSMLALARVISTIMIFLH